MNNHYANIEDVFRNNHGINFEKCYDPTDDSLWIDIKMNLTKVGHVLIQNFDAPEVDIVLYSSSWYFSLGSSESLNDRIKLVYSDIISTMSEKKQYSSNRTLFGQRKTSAYIDLPKSNSILRGKKIIID